jgi:hypothetical protein
MAVSKYVMGVPPQTLGQYVKEELRKVEAAISGLFKKSLMKEQSTVDADNVAATFDDHVVTTGAPGAGGAGALPATPAGYMWVSINGANHLIAYY